MDHDHDHDVETTEAPALDRAAILAATNGKPPRELVYVPAWHGSVWCRCLTAGQRDHLETEAALARQKGRPTHYRARLVLLGTETAQGQSLFGTADIKRLSEMPAGALEPIVDAVLRLSKMRPEDVEAVEGNSDGGPSGDS